MRQRQAGVTLVEVLVVLVLVAVAAGAVGLAIGPATRGGGVAQASQLLTARLNRASDEAMMTGQPVAFVWSDAAYHFEILQGTGWQPHPVPILGSPQTLGSGMHFGGDSGPDGRFEVGPSLYPVAGEPLNIALVSGTAIARIDYDGATARPGSDGGS